MPENNLTLVSSCLHLHLAEVAWAVTVVNEYIHEGLDRIPRQVVKLQHAADNVTLFLCPLHYIVTTICMHAAFDAGNHDTNGHLAHGCCH